MFRVKAQLDNALRRYTFWSRGCEEGGNDAFLKRRVLMHEMQTLYDLVMADRERIEHDALAFGIFEIITRKGSRGDFQPPPPRMCSSKF